MLNSTNKISRKLVASTPTWSLHFCFPHSLSCTATETHKWNSHISTKLICNVTTTTFGFSFLLHKVQFYRTFFECILLLWRPRPKCFRYTGCLPRRNGQNFGRVFLMLKYTDITQNTYVQSWTVTEIMAREIWKYDSCYTLTDYQIHIKTGRNMWFLSC